MRIAKTQAVCRRQVSKLQGLSFGMMDGKAVRAAEQRINMQAAIGTAHFAFYDSLTAANSKNMSLLYSLPETSPGVLDTAVAERRMEDALRQMRLLRQAMDAAIEQVRRANACMWDFLSQHMQEGGELEWTPIDEGPVRTHYQALIDGQRAVAQANKIILRRASEYDRKSLEAYRSVEVSCLRQAMSSSRSFASTGTWGDTSWVVPLRERVNMGEDQRPCVRVSPNQNVVAQFLRGELKEENSAFGMKAQATSVPLGIPLSGAASGEILLHVWGNRGAGALWGKGKAGGVIRPACRQYRVQGAGGHPQRLVGRLACVGRGICPKRGGKRRGRGKRPLVPNQRLAGR